jgi:hypothetical protein
MVPHLEAKSAQQVQSSKVSTQQVEAAIPQSSMLSLRQVMKGCRCKPVFIGAVCHLRLGGHLGFITGIQKKTTYMLMKALICCLIRSTV